MSISVTFNNAHQLSLASEFFIARRPVVDRAQNLVAHELLFCEIAARGTLAADERPAAAPVVADVCRHGMERVLGDLFGVLYIDAEALMSDIFQWLPPQSVVLEVAQVPEMSPRMVERVAELTQAGFRFALVVDDPGRVAGQLLSLVEGVRFDITGMDEAALRRFCASFGAHGKKLLAERVETPEQFDACLAAGFDFFQGYHFTRPQIRDGKTLYPSQVAIAELIAQLAADADISIIEERLKGDVALGLSLLRLANTPAISQHRIDSLRQLVMALGRDELRRLLKILLCAVHGDPRPGMAALLAQAAMRGRLMELVAQKQRPGNRGVADTAFIVGIMSLMDAMFDMPMADVLRQIFVVDEVRDALLGRQGYFGQLLLLAEYTEWQKKTDTLLLQSIRDLNLSHSDLYAFQLAAFEWSDHVTRGVH